jgi:hypothetical protein
MGLYYLIDRFPLLMLFTATTLIASLSYECGFRAGNWRSRRPVPENEVVVRLMVGSMLALLTFILGFTFWLAASHFDSARQALLNEANAIRTSYLRADLLPEPHRTEIRNLLREYVDIRLEGARSGNIQQAIDRSEKLHAQIWSQTIASREKVSSPIFTGYFIQSLNDVIALHTRRLTVGREFRIPPTIWIVLYLIMPLAAASIGFHGGLTGPSRPLVAVAFIVIISVVLTLIADLDSPRIGTLRVRQQALADLQNMMNNPYP